MTGATVSATASTDAAVAEVMRELAALEDPQMREANERRGDDHGVNLSRLRALAKRLKTQHDLARDLWATDDTAAKLLAILICRPKAFERDELDAMLREAGAPKAHDWLVNYVVKKYPHSEQLRLAWLGLRRGGSRAVLERIGGGGCGREHDQGGKRQGVAEHRRTLELDRRNMKPKELRLRTPMMKRQKFDRLVNARPGGI